MRPESTERAGEAREFRRTRRNLTAMAGIAAFSLIAAAATSKKANAFASPNPPSKGGNPSCLLAGTLIETPEGPKAIETLTAGDCVLTARGAVQRVCRIHTWEAYRLPNQIWPANVAPVRVAHSAIADNVPSRDLYLSPNHALYLEGELVAANALVNGLSITRDCDYRAAKLSYFHIELEAHDVVIAEGLPVETFLGVAMTPVAPSAIGNGRWAHLMSRARSALALAYDTRTRFDRLRDRIEDRAEAV